VTQSGDANRPSYKFIDSRELAAHWGLPDTWIRERVRSRCQDPFPHVRFGKCVRFRWGSPGWAEGCFQSAIKHPQ
jgi:hypothetical protein